MNALATPGRNYTKDRTKTTRRYTRRQASCLVVHRAIVHTCVACIVLSSTEVREMTMEAGCFSDNFSGL